MIRIDKTTAKKLVLESDYQGIFTETVRSNGGNSAKINCKKEFIDNNVLVFILGDGKSGDNKKEGSQKL